MLMMPLDLPTGIAFDVLLPVTGIVGYNNRIEFIVPYLALLSCST